MEYKTECKGDGIPQRIRRPIPQDELYIVVLEVDPVTEWERDETWYVFSTSLDGARRNAIRKLTDNGWQYDPGGGHGYFYNPQTQDCARIDLVRKFDELEAINGTLSTLDLMYFLQQKDFDLFYATHVADPVKFPIIENKEKEDGSPTIS